MCFLGSHTQKTAPCGSCATAIRPASIASNGPLSTLPPAAHHGCGHGIGAGHRKVHIPAVGHAGTAAASCRPRRRPRPCRRVYGPLGVGNIERCPAEHLRVKLLRRRRYRWSSSPPSRTTRARSFRSCSRAIPPRIILREHAPRITRRSAAAVWPPGRSSRSGGWRPVPRRCRRGSIRRREVVAPVRIAVEERIAAVDRAAAVGVAQEKAARAGVKSPPRLPTASSCWPEPVGHSTLYSSPR